MRRLKKSTFYLIFLIVTFVKCGRETPLNPNDQLPPLSIESSIASGGSISIDSITFALKSNSERTEFRFRLNDSEWSEFSSNYSLIFKYLDDGDYTLEVEARNAGWETVSSKSFPFTVLTQTTSSAYLYPQKSHYQIGNPIQCQLKISNLNSFDKIHIELQGVNIQSVTLPPGIDSQKTTILKSSTVIDLFLHPDYQNDFSDSLTLLNLLVSPETNADTVQATISAIARNSKNESVEISKTRGCILIKK